MSDLNIKDIPFLKSILIMSDEELSEERKKIMNKTISSLTSKTVSNNKHHMRRSILLNEIIQMTLEERLEMSEKLKNTLFE